MGQEHASSSWVGDPPPYPFSLHPFGQPNWGFNIFGSYARQGWECPKCSRVYSPDTMMCFYCPVQTVTITSVSGEIKIGPPDASDQARAPEEPPLERAF